MRRSKLFGAILMCVAGSMAQSDSISVVSTSVKDSSTPAKIMVIDTGANKPYSPIVTENSNPGLDAPITLWAKDASLSEVLKVLSERSNMNFVAGEGVHREKITIILNKTPLDEAINLLVRAAGLAYEIIGNSVLIAEPGKLKDEVGQSGYVIELKYASADEVAEMLGDLTKNIKVDRGGNRLICYTSPRVINEIERVVKSVDKPNMLVLLDTRVIEVSMDDLDEIGINWASMSPVQSGVSRAESPITEAFKAANWQLMAMEMNVALDALVQQGDAQLLMNSKLTTTNNRPANLHIGEIIPYTIQSFNLGSSGGANYEIQKEEVGVKINMLPHINEDNQITLTLEPEISSIIGWKGPNNDIPLVRVRTTKTTIRVEDKQTIFIAGLIAEEKSEEIQKFPLLGDIPLIGLLFQHKKEVIQKKNLIIEVTPRIIYNPDDFHVWEDLKGDAIAESSLADVFENDETVEYKVPESSKVKAESRKERREREKAEKKSSKQN